MFLVKYVFKQFLVEIVSCFNRNMLIEKIYVLTNELEIQVFHRSEHVSGHDTLWCLSVCDDDAKRALLCSANVHPPPEYTDLHSLCSAKLIHLVQLQNPQLAVVALL